MKTKLSNHQIAAIVVAVIVALADTVIVYDLHLSGTWLSPSWLSWLKTSAFVLLFIGSLIAEMQDLRRGTRLLLLGCVVLLGAYQAGVNIVVNYHAANIPPSALALFDGWLAPAQVKLWYSVIDGAVRTLVVVLMWLVTGLVWRGVATTEGGASVDVGQVATLQAEHDKLQDRVLELQEWTQSLTGELQAARADLQAAETFGKLPQDAQIRWLKANRDGLTNRDIAGVVGVSESTVSRNGR